MRSDMLHWVGGLAFSIIVLSEKAKIGDSFEEDFVFSECRQPGDQKSVQEAGSQIKANKVHRYSISSEFPNKLTKD